MFQLSPLSNKAPLQVVNASAGSGKTYSLVKMYIHLLLVDFGEINERKYAEILAMTFTNKAAIEMKTRIIKALDMLAYPVVHQSEGYLNEIAKETNLKTHEVQIKAKRLLSSILHQYEDFNVMTIDKFNLRLIRSFSRDLDMPSDFEVVLNETPIIEQVVDQMMDEIGKNEQLSDLLLQYAKANIEQEKSWNLRQSLIEFGKILSKEYDLPYVNRLMNMEFSKEEYQELWQSIRTINEDYTLKRKEIAEIFRQFSFEQKDFSRGKDIFNAVLKLTNPQLQVSDPFCFTSTNMVNIERAAEEKGGNFSVFSQHITALHHWHEQYQEKAQIIKVYIKNYFNMALLKHMNLSLLALNKAERFIRISEFNTKIAELIQEDTPYIYEKLGTRFRHFMLDEFQDTSRLQWLNLIPLIEESLAKGSSNFIVGDPKQAIYRFKNGVAEQFVELPGLYNPEKSEQLAQKSVFFKQMGDVFVLQDNWRSAPEIVNFNNQLFASLKENLAPNYREFYKALEQNPKSDKQGFVYLSSYAKESNTSYQQRNEKRLHFILSALETCLQDGFLPSDICILGRGNAFCNWLAFELTQRNYSVVSADSLHIDSELTVRFVISYLSLRLQPTNVHHIRQFIHLYCQLYHFPISHYYSLLQNEKNETDQRYQTINLERFFEQNPALLPHFFAPFDTLYDLIQKTFHLFELNELKNPYLHHLADLIYSFERRAGTNLQLFIEEYPNMPKEHKALQIAESENALKVMTIHKSKGLEFPIVIIVNEQESQIKDDFFIQTDSYLLRGTLSKNSAIEEVKKSYEDESAKRYLDTINLYYVGYTRAVERLYIHNEYGTSGFSYHLHQIVSSLYKNVQSDNTFIIGNKTAKKTAKKKDNIFYVPQSSSDNLWFPDIALHEADTLIGQNELTEEIRYGNQLHALIAQATHTEQDFQYLIQTGQVELAFLTRLRIDIHALYSDSYYQQLMKNCIDIKHEQAIIMSKTKQIRPDTILFKKDTTIILEYKTGIRQSEHKKQLAQYCRCLQEMNFPNVIGFLIYIWSGNIEFEQISA